MHVNVFILQSDMIYLFIDTLKTILSMVILELDTCYKICHMLQDYLE